MMVETMAGFASNPSSFQLCCNDRERLVAIDQMTAFVHNHHAVGIAVERNADIRTHFAHLSGQSFR